MALFSTNESDICSYLEVVLLSEEAFHSNTEVTADLAVINVQESPVFH